MKTTALFRTARTQCVIIPLEMTLAILYRQRHTIRRLERVHLALQTLECAIHIRILEEFRLQALPPVAVVGIHPAEAMDVADLMEALTGLIPVALLLEEVVL